MMHRTEEDDYFVRRDRELIERLRDVADDEQRRNVRTLSYLRCPTCGARLTRSTHYGVAVAECPAGHGMWLTESEHHTLAKRERDSWLWRWLYWLHA